MDSIEETEEDTPQSLLDDDCVNDEGYQLKRHEKTATATPSNSRCYTKSSTSSSVGTATSFRSSRKRRFNKKKSLKSTQQQQPPPQPQSTSNNQTKKKKKSNNHQQLFLDFGQSSFGKRSVCNICGMLRVHGVTEDDIQHAKVCKDYKEGVTCLGWKNERTLIHFNNDKTTPTRNDDRIIEVRDCDVVQHRRKVLEVKRIVDAELGFAISGRQGSTSGGLGDKDDDNVVEDPLNGLTSYLYISKKRVVGLLLVKRIQRAYQVVLPNNANDTDDKKTASSFSISRSLKSTRALLGIHQIWVHSSHRNKGIASKLVTAARDHLIFGMAIPLELVAFSSPTEEGLQFARSYVGVERPLVYDI
jgi:N-acetyltransferase